MAIIGHVDARDLAADLVDQAELITEVFSADAIVHPDGINTNCDTLAYGKHVVFSDGTNTTTPNQSGLYYIEAVKITVEAGVDVIGQRAWRFSTGLLYMRLYRNSVWSTWNKVG